MVLNQPYHLLPTQIKCHHLPLAHQPPHQLNHKRKTFQQQMLEL
jgi:hypothetical protein